MMRATRVALATVTTLAAVAGCGSGAGSSPAPSQIDAGPADSSYASIGGLQMYYEVHGPETGRPLVLLHGSLSGIAPDFGALIPVLARDRRVIAVEQQAHGHTADIDRPLRVEQMAADTASLLRQLGVQQADVLGFSTGAAVALDMGLKEPGLVHKLVLASPMYDPAGMHPGLIDGLAALQPEMLHGTPYHEYYKTAAPRPDDFGTLVEKNKDLQLNYPKHPASTVGSSGCAGSPRGRGLRCGADRPRLGVPPVARRGRQRRHRRPPEVPAGRAARHDPHRSDAAARAAFDDPGLPRCAGDGVAGNVCATFPLCSHGSSAGRPSWTSSSAGSRGHSPAAPGWR